MSEPKDDLIVVEAQLPEELILDVGLHSTCPGDDCNGDQGGCDAADASCGQDC